MGSCVHRLHHTHPPSNVVPQHQSINRSTVALFARHSTTLGYCASNLSPGSLRSHVTDRATLMCFPRPNTRLFIYMYCCTFGVHHRKVTKPITDLHTKQNTASFSATLPKITTHRPEMRFHRSVTVKGATGVFRHKNTIVLISWSRACDNAPEHLEQIDFHKACF